MQVFYFFEEKLLTSFVYLISKVKTNSATARFIHCSIVLLSVRCFLSWNPFWWSISFLWDFSRGVHTYNDSLKIKEMIPRNQKFIKSDIFQYNILVRWVAGTNDSAATKRLMFQVFFFFMISCRILRKNTFNLFVYFFKKIQK